MNHSVQAYLDRIPINQLILFLENDLFAGTYAINDAILQDIFEALISRNTAEGGCLFPYIHAVQEIQVKRKQAAR